MFDRRKEEVRVKKSTNTVYSSRILRGRGGGVLLGILGRGVPPGSPNPDPIFDQNISFSTPVFTAGL